jgi:plastocyanin
MRRLLIPTLAAASLLMVGPTIAQSPAASPPAGSPAAGVEVGASPGTQPTGETITVIGRDYAFEGLPTTVPAGTALAFRNEGSELHELIVVRRNEGTTETWEELLALPDEEVFTKITFVGQVFAEPGQTADATIVVDQEGEYFAVCFVPQGMTEVPAEPEMPAGSPAVSGSPDAGSSPGAASSPSAAASQPAFGPPHFVLGMQQVFTVTAPDTTPGPLPSPAASMDHGTPTTGPGASPATDPVVSPDAPEASPAA